MYFDKLMKQYSNNKINKLTNEDNIITVIIGSGDILGTYLLDENIINNDGNSIIRSKDYQFWRFTQLDPMPYRHLTIIPALVQQHYKIK